jgi:hypothetical protein
MPRIAAAFTDGRRGYARGGGVSGAVSAEWRASVAVRTVVVEAAGTLRSAETAGSTTADVQVVAPHDPPLGMASGRQPWRVVSPHASPAVVTTLRASDIRCSCDARCPSTPATPCRSCATRAPDRANASQSPRLPPRAVWRSIRIVSHATNGRQRRIGGRRLTGKSPGRQAAAGSCLECRPPPPTTPSGRHAVLCQGCPDSGRRAKERCHSERSEESRSSRARPSPLSGTLRFLACGASRLRSE